MLAMRMAFQLVISVLVLTVFSGCVVNQKVDLSYSPDRFDGVKQNTPVNVTVEDARPDVRMKQKQGTYVGSLRNNFGAPMNVNTKSGQPLAEIIKRDLSSDLGTLGFKVTDSATVKKVYVVINEWKFDAYLNTKFWYNIDVTILDGQNNKLMSHQLKDEVDIEGSAWTGAKGSMMREVPKLHSGIIRKLVRENAQAMRALE